MSSELSRIYARLTARLVEDLMRIKGMSREEATKVALEHTLKGAADFAAGIEDTQQRWVTTQKPKGD